VSRDLIAATATKVDARLRAAGQIKRRDNHFELRGMVSEGIRTPPTAAVFPHERPRAGGANAATKRSRE